MRRWEWIKTILAAALAVALMLLLGNRDAFYNWIEALIDTGILFCGFYGNLPVGLLAGGVGGLLRWYIAGGEVFSVIASMAGGMFCAFFRKLGKGASGLAFFCGTIFLYLLLDWEMPSGLFEALLIAMAVFLLVSPESKPGRRKSVSVYGKKSLPDESAAAAVPVISGSRADGKRDFAGSYASRQWKRLADSFFSLAQCFEDQKILLQQEENLSSIEWKQRFEESRHAIRLQFMQAGQVIWEQQQKIESWSDVTDLYHAGICRNLKVHRVCVDSLQIMENPQGRQEIFARLACKKSVYKTGACMSAQELGTLLHTKAGKQFCPAYDCRSIIGAQWGQVHFIEKQSFQVLYGISRKTKDGSSDSGDSFSVDMLGEERMMLCLSDGMGSGKKAGMESKMAVEFLENLLENGFSLTAAVSMLNHVLLNWRNFQTPTTLDICLLDLYDGKCHFVKMGASSGYLKRKENVSAIYGQAVPLGMIFWEEHEANMVCEEQLQDGDMLVMMTDGVSEKAGLASDEILKDLISGCKTNNAQEMADWLMEQLLLLDDTIYDDMTILVAGVWRK